MTLKTVVEQLIAARGVREVLSLANCDFDTVLDAVLAKTPAADILSALAIPVAEGDDREELVRSTLVGFDLDRLNEGADQAFAEHLAADLLLAYVASDEESAASVFVTDFGEQVAGLAWDGGGPGLSGGEVIYRLGDSYWYYSESGCYGPEETLADAVEAYFTVTEATESIHCEGLTPAQLCDLLELDDSIEPGYTVILNGETFVSEDGLTLRPQK